MKKTVFYAGSFDPVTYGHLDLIERSAKLFHKVVIGIGVHHEKKTLLSEEERKSVLADVTSGLQQAEHIEIVTFDGLVVDAARAAGANAILRGIRDTTDFNYEMQMVGMNSAVAPDIDTLFLPASGAHRHIAATFVRQIAQMGGDISAFVPPLVAVLLKEKLSTLHNK